jgi:hypothetical protein
MNNAALESRKSHGRSRVTNGNELFVEPTDRRTAISRRFRDILSAIVADLGGADRLSEGQRQLARRVALMCVECERMEARSVSGETVDLDMFGQLSDRIGRACQRLGLKRVPREIVPDLRTYIAGSARR